MSLESQPCFFSARATLKPSMPFSTANMLMVWLRPASPVLAATKIEVAVHAVGDEHLGAVEHVAAGALLRALVRMEAEVGAGIRLPVMATAVILRPA